MPKKDIKVRVDDKWVLTTINVRARNPALESASTYEHNIAVDISRTYGHEGIGWTVERGSRNAQADFEALITVMKSTKQSNLNDILTAMNTPIEPRAHRNKYERFSRHS